MVFQQTLVQYVRAAIAKAIRTRIATTAIMILTDPVRLLITALRLPADLPEVMTTPGAIITGTTIAAMIATVPTAIADSITVIPAGLILRQVKVPAQVVHLAEAAAEAAAHPEGLPDKEKC